MPDPVALVSRRAAQRLAHLARTGQGVTPCEMLVWFMAQRAALTGRTCWNAAEETAEVARAFVA